MIPQDVYAGLDVSQETTAICVVDSTGATVWRGSCPTGPASIAGALRRHAPGARLTGLETGQLSNWLTRTLCELELPVVCLDARHAKAALKLQVNKTDANDAWRRAGHGWRKVAAVPYPVAHDPLAGNVAAKPGAGTPPLLFRGGISKAPAWLER